LTVLFYLLGVLFFLSVFGVFFRVRELAASVWAHKKEVGVAALFAALFFITKPLFQHHWQGLSYSTAYLVSALLKLSYSAVSFTPQDYGLAVQGFRVNIYEPCSGVEGITLFVCSYVSYLMVDWPLVRKGIAFAAGLLGIVAMYLANVLRIYAIMVLGFEVSQRMGIEAAYTLVVRYFHAHIGWFLYGGVILVFIASSRGFIMRRDRPKGAVHAS
jgi:hypothetical protein